jgi:hypothetical protein
MLGKFPDLAARQAFAARNSGLFDLFTTILEGRSGGGSLNITWHLQSLLRKRMYLSRTEKDVSLADVFRIMSASAPEGKDLLLAARKAAADAGLREVALRNGIFVLLEEAFVDWLGARKPYPMDPIPSLQWRETPEDGYSTTVGAALCRYYGRLPETEEQVPRVRGLVPELLALAFPSNNRESALRDEVAVRFPDLPAIAEEVLTRSSILESRVHMSDQVHPSGSIVSFQAIACLLALRGYDFGPLDSMLGRIWTRPLDFSRTPMEAAFYSDVSTPLQESLRNGQSYLTPDSEGNPLVFRLVTRKQYSPSELRPYWGVRNSKGKPLVQHMMEADRTFIPDEFAWDIASSTGRSVKEMLVSRGKIGPCPTDIGELSGHEWGVFRGMVEDVCRRGGAKRLENLDLALAAIEAGVPEPKLHAPAEKFLSAFCQAIDETPYHDPKLVESAHFVLKYPHIRNAVVSVRNQSTARSVVHQLFLVFAERYFSFRLKTEEKGLQSLILELIRAMRPSVLREALSGVKGANLAAWAMEFPENPPAGTVLDAALKLNQAGVTARSLQVDDSLAGEPEPFL